jgi:hypothetical protein
METNAEWMERLYLRMEQRAAPEDPVEEVACD